MKMYNFSYGMNTNVDTMSRLCPTAKYMGKALLHNHRLVFKTYADIEPYDHDMLGVLWQIDDAALAALDYCEGYPSFYSRKIVNVIHKGKHYDAWVYYMVGKAMYHSPSKGYLQTVIDGYKHADIPLHITDGDFL